MDFILLTKSTTFIIGPVASVLGWIMNLLFELTSFFGVMNIGLCIILFTLLMKLLMLPLTIKQQKSTKLMSVINPEIQAIQKKYKDKKDQESLAKQNLETQAVYAKYGTSQMAGCLPVLLQMPILFSLYQVINRIPAYVTSVRAYYDPVVAFLQKEETYVGKVTDLVTSKGFTIGTFDFTKIGTQFSELHVMRLFLGLFDFSNVDKMVDVLYKFKPVDWNALSKVFSSSNDIISTNADKIIDMNQFFGLSLLEAPGFKLSFALIIPVLAGLTQWLSTKMMATNQETDPNSPTASTMKAMNLSMPLMSAVFCVSFPIGIGIYWIATSLFQIIQQFIVNLYMDKVDINDMIAKNVDKMNKKRAKKGLPPSKVSQVANINVKNKLTETPKETVKKEDKDERVKDSTEYYKNTEKNPNSIAAKASMVKKFNEKNNK